MRSAYDEFGFDDHPECIYNMDETGVPLEPRPPKNCCGEGAEKDLVSYFRTEITDYSHWLWECYWPEVTWMKQSTQTFAAFVLVRMTKI